ncbi:MAG: tRNA 2-thiouridine(34) synthase MnmA [Thermoleophilaceae bacterium]
MADPSTFEHHVGAPRGRGALAGAPHSGAAGGAPCGDLIRVSLEVEDGVVAAAGFDASGCGAIVAAGSAVVELVEGKPALVAARMGAREVAAELGGLSPGKLHAADLAADALHRALGVAARDGAIELAPSPHRTLVAMSGGVDSTVAARLALDAGDEVVGVTLELWGDPENDGARSCCSAQAVLGARALAHRMGLAHLTIDLREPFRRDVVDDFLAEHAAGRTPNPCVRCNGLVRFDAMLELAARLGARRLATGHYARVVRDEQGPLLRAAADPAKDQAYMLARLDAGELERLWFPLGDLKKPEVREIARAAALPVAEKPDSQDLCFLAGTSRARFLRRHGPPPSVPGEIVGEQGEVLGAHGGHEEYTVGQRRGLGVAAREPLYVLRKDARSNRLTVGTRAALATDRVSLRGVELRRPAGEVDGVKLRYRQPPVPCRVEGETLRLAQAVDGVAPGQTACLLRGDVVVGSGVIDG